MEKKQLTKLQKEFLKAYDNSACNVSVACKKVGIARQTYYLWKNTSELFSQEVEDMEESLLDFAETKLHQNIMSGKESSIFFYLKTKGKKRGYIETTEHDVTLNPFEKLMKELPDVD